MSEMKLSCDWKGGLAFTAEVRGHAIVMDAKKESGGGDTGPTPKETALAGVCGCTGIDVASILKTMRQPPSSIRIGARAFSRSKEPNIFEKVELDFHIEGEGIVPAKALRAVELSQTKYCSVSAMVALAGAEIRFRVILNGTEVGTGQAKFSLSL